MKIILASASPRRKEMLEKLGIPFTIIVSSKDEKNHQDHGFRGFRELAMENARIKAENVAESILKKNDNNKEMSNEPVLIIGADTIVVIDNVLLPKPADKEDAKRMITMLSGKTHKVITGITIIRLPDGKIIEDYEETKVIFRSLQPEDVEKYISTGEYSDKAGAYGIQGYGVFLVDSIEGDYNNVVGLPLMKLYKTFRHFDVDLMDLVEGN